MVSFLRHRLPSVAASVLSLLAVALAFGAGFSCSFLTVASASTGRRRLSGEEDVFFAEEAIESAAADDGSSDDVGDGEGAVADELEMGLGDDAALSDGNTSAADLTVVTAAAGTLAPDSFAIGLFCDSDYATSADDAMWTLSRNFLIAALVFGPLALLLLTAISFFVPPTLRLWKLSSILAGLAGALQVPAFLLFESEVCKSGDYNCGVSSGCVLLILSTICHVSTVIITAACDPPRWYDVRATWLNRSRSKSDYHDGGATRGGRWFGGFRERFEQPYVKNGDTCESDDEQGWEHEGGALAEAFAENDAETADRDLAAAMDGAGVGVVAAAAGAGAAAAVSEGAERRDGESAAAGGVKAPSDGSSGDVHSYDEDSTTGLLLRLNSGGYAKMASECGSSTGDRDQSIVEEANKLNRKGYAVMAGSVGGSSIGGGGSSIGEAPLAGAALEDFLAAHEEVPPPPPPAAVMADDAAPGPKVVAEENALQRMEEGAAATSAPQDRPAPIPAPVLVPVVAPLIIAATNNKDDDDSDADSDRSQVTATSNLCDFVDPSVDYGNDDDSDEEDCPDDESLADEQAGRRPSSVSKSFMKTSLEISQASDSSPQDIMSFVDGSPHALTDASADTSTESGLGGGGGPPGTHIEFCPSDEGANSGGERDVDNSHIIIVPTKTIDMSPLRESDVGQKNDADDFQNGEQQFYSDQSAVLRPPSECGSVRADLLGGDDEDGTMSARSSVCGSGLAERLVSRTSSRENLASGALKSIESSFKALAAAGSLSKKSKSSSYGDLRDRRGGLDGLDDIGGSGRSTHATANRMAGLELDDEGNPVDPTIEDDIERGADGDEGMWSVEDDVERDDDDDDFDDVPPPPSDAEPDFADPPLADISDLESSDSSDDGGSGSRSSYRSSAGGSRDGDRSSSSAGPHDVGGATTEEEEGGSDGVLLAAAGATNAGSGSRRGRKKKGKGGKRRRRRRLKSSAVSLGSRSICSHASLLDETIDEETDQDLRSELSSSEDDRSTVRSSVRGGGGDRDRIQMELDRAGGVMGANDDDRWNKGEDGAPVTSISIDNLVAMKYGLTPLDVTDTERDSGYEAAAVTPSPPSAAPRGGAFSVLDEISSPVSPPQFEAVAAAAPAGCYAEAWTSLGFAAPEEATAATSSTNAESEQSATSSQKRRGRTTRREIERSRSLPPKPLGHSGSRASHVLSLDPPSSRQQHGPSSHRRSNSALPAPRPHLHSSRRPKPTSWREERKLRSPLHHTVSDSESDSYDSESTGSSYGRSVNSSVSYKARNARKRRLSLQRGHVGGSQQSENGRSRTCEPPMDRAGWNPAAEVAEMSM